MLIPSAWQETARAGDSFDQALDPRRVETGWHSLGRSHDILIAGDGDDLMVGGSGREVLIGGYGSDRLVPVPGNDTLNIEIASDANDAVLEMLFTDWSWSDSNTARLRNHGPVIEDLATTVL